ncbi:MULTISPECIES: amino acid ABC transporter substrate-binding protein [unclassified Acidovorax]|uniref:amino acid ABC transporter substrate-binding protein n=1 Tax=unclassified Acidovorax TaxID=2684926 RepID=UPI001C465752|nr:MULTISPECIES: amino acid ABC transporter substrate-binding protein [unclassified Acidovorax]MBV7427364.1 amino acid ABC transporter substrate-binding protein [Acidovorax sp. sif0732]MBV7448488.1 amino acid ABC transporter substrate-binding protein [Acidovorax sp. sif0715]
MKLHFNLLVASAFAVAFAAHAQSPAGTLDRIKETGEIRIGHRESSVPFSYLLDDGKPVGFAMDLCGHVVEAVKAELKKPDVKVVLRPVNLSTQIPLLQNQSVDIVCGPATNTVERQKQIAFSNTIFVSSIRAAVKKDGGVEKFSDLNGKTAAVTAASTSIALLTKFEQEKKIEVKKVTSPDHAQSFLMLSTGRAQAFVMDDILLASLIANSSKPSDFKIIDDALRVEPYGLVLRKDDPQFKAIVDRTLASLNKSGEFQKIYAKWFSTPIPPKNVNLNFPMTKALTDALSNPNDKGIE